MMSDSHQELVVKNLIRTLENAIQVCYDAPDDPELGYPYATGYSRAAMQTVLSDLQRHFSK